MRSTEILIEMGMYAEVLNWYRETKDEFVLESFKYKHNGKEGYGLSSDANYDHRKELILELYNDYSAHDKPLIKWLLQEGLKSMEHDLPAASIDLCAFMLYKYMENEDVYLLYEAKFGAGTDLMVYVDIELVFGLDILQTKQFLKGDKTRIEDSQEVLRAIKHYEGYKEAQYKKREAYIQYFESKKINTIRVDIETM